LNLKKQDLLRNLQIRSNNNSNRLLNRFKLRHLLNKRPSKRLRRKLLIKRLLRKNLLPSKKLLWRRRLLSKRR